MSIVKKTKDNNSCCDVGKEEPSFADGQDVTWCSQCGISKEDFKIIKLAYTSVVQCFEYEPERI